jgi:hypothetical protein
MTIASISNKVRSWLTVATVLIEYVGAAPEEEG